MNVQTEYINALGKRCLEAERQRDRLAEALLEITKGKGAFSLDPLTHAENTIDDMKGIARTALAELEKP